jgi:nucleotide-binding universal stress UspA family protein
MGQDKLLVLLDGSERALDAVHYVASVKTFSSMSVVVLFNVYAQLPQSYLDLERMPENSDEKQQILSWRNTRESGQTQYMRRAEKILKKSGVAEVEVKLRQITLGVARDILTEARQDYSSIVMTRRGMGLLAGLPIGSVANKLLQSISFIPIILAAQKACSERILIAVDGSEDSMRAVSFAAKMAGENHQIGLIHVIRNRPDPEFIMTRKETLRIKSYMEATFEKMKEQLIKNGIQPENVTSKIIEDAESRAGALIDEAWTGGYDTIVIGRKGLSQTDFPLGRVSTKIVQMADRHAVWLV